jgi:hypothetical protein
LGIEARLETVADRVEDIRHAGRIRDRHNFLFLAG